MHLVVVIVVVVVVVVVVVFARLNLSIDALLLFHVPLNSYSLMGLQDIIFKLHEHLHAHFMHLVVVVVVFVFCKT